MKAHVSHIIFFLFFPKYSTISMYFRSEKGVFIRIV